jgi:hypothetical protein
MASDQGRRIRRIRRRWPALGDIIPGVALVGGVFLYGIAIVLTIGLAQGFPPAGPSDQRPGPALVLGVAAKHVAIGS